MEEDLKQSLLKKRILIVDDLEDNQEVLLALLEERGFEHLFTANDGNVALRVLNNNTDIDLVLLDIHMPGMDGYEVLQKMTSNNRIRHIPVIMVTAIDQLQSIARCIQAGAEDYITKPVDENLLWDRVYASLESKYFRDMERTQLLAMQPNNSAPKDAPEASESLDTESDDTIENASVLVVHIVGIEYLSVRVSTTELTRILNYISRSFDLQAKNNQLEKFQSTATSYLVAGGIPPFTNSGPERCLAFGRAVLQYVSRFKEIDSVKLQARLGMHTGSVRSGLEGESRFTYNLWGDTVEFAKELAAAGKPGHIQVSASAYDQLADKSPFTQHENVEIAGGGEIATYLSTGEVS